MSLRALILCASLISLTAAQAAVPGPAKAEIGKFNSDWGPAMEKGDTDAVVAAYGPDAVFCSAGGKCYSGLDAITAMTRAAIAARGPAKSATAHTTRMVEDRGYIYEWGQAKIVNAQGAANGGSYFTIWKQQPDGHWKIFRNIVLP